MSFRIVPKPLLQGALTIYAGNNAQYIVQYLRISMDGYFLFFDLNNSIIFLVIRWQTDGQLGLTLPKTQNGIDNGSYTSCSVFVHQLTVVYLVKKFPEE
jgi:hypothetical protein